MNAFSDTLNTLTTKIMFVSQSNPGGGGSPVPQTGDVIGMIFAIIAAITLISIFAIFIGTKKSSTVQANGSLAKTKSIGIVLGIVAAISLLGILFCYTPLGNAFAQEQVESAATINAYVNEETGEITFDENYIKNNTTKDIVVEASDMEMTEDMATISGIENLEFTITGMDSVLFKGTLAQPGEERTPQDPYDNLNNTVGSGQTTAVTYTLENYDKNLALSLIGKEVCFTTLNSVNAVKFSYGVGEGAEGEAPKIQVLTNKHNTIEIQPLDTEEIVKWGYSATNWKDSAGNTYEPGSTVTLADDSTNLALTPNWVEDANVTITYAAEAGGTVSPTSESVAPATGTATGSTATAGDGYKFDHWKNASGESISTKAKLTPPKNEHGIYETATYTAVFVKDGPVPPVEQYTISFATEDEDKGSPSEESAQFPKSTALTYTINSTSGTITFTSGSETKDVAANAESGYVFSKWTIKTSSSAETDAPASGTITEDVTFKCYFVEDTREATIIYTIVDEDNAHGTLKLDGESDEGYKFTQTVNVTAGEDEVKGVTATPCDPIYYGNRYPYVYYFLNWTLETSDSSTVVSTEINFKPSKVDGLWTSGTYVAHFATPIATYTSINSTMEFFYDEYQHDCTYQYPVNNTSIADENGAPVYAAWQSESDGTPAVYPRTVKFNESFKNYTGLTSMSYWFWSPWEADDGADIAGRIDWDLQDLLNKKERDIPDLSQPSSGGIKLSVDLQGRTQKQHEISFGYQQRVLQNIEGLANVNTLNLEQTAYMFSSNNNEDYSMEKLDFSAWNCPKLTSMQYMFDGCWGLREIYLPTDEEGHYFGANATNMSNMFEGCSSLASIEINGKFGEKATDMSCMFMNCDSLIKFNPAQNSTFGLAVIDTQDMFNWCYSLREVHLNSNFGAKVQIMEGMFYECEALNYFDNKATKFGTEVKKMNNMFDCCYSLSAIDLSAFVTPSTYPQNDFGYIFNYCYSLKQFKIGNGWNVKMSDASLPENGWYNNEIRYVIKNIPFPASGGKVIGEFACDSAKAVYNVGETSNELKFVWDHTYYTNRIFNVPESSGFVVGRSQQWYEQGWNQQAEAAAESEARNNYEDDQRSVFETLIDTVGNNYGDPYWNYEYPEYMFPEWFNFCWGKKSAYLECVLDGTVEVKFDTSFKKFQDLYSMSCWFIADSFGKQPFTFTQSTGWNNIYTYNIQSVACMFGGFSNELASYYANWDKDDGYYVNFLDSPSAETGKRIYVTNDFQNPNQIADTYGTNIKTLDLSNLSFSYDSQYKVLDLSGMFANCVSLQSVTLPTFSSDTPKAESFNEESPLSDNQENKEIDYSYSFNGNYFGGFTGLFYNCRSLTTINKMKETAQYYMENNYPLSYYKMFFNNKAITEFNMDNVIPLDINDNPSDCYLNYILTTYAGYYDDYNSFAFSDMLRGCDKLEKLYFCKDNPSKNQHAMLCYDMLGLHFDNMGLIEDANIDGPQEGCNLWRAYYNGTRQEQVFTYNIPTKMTDSRYYPDYYVRDPNPGYAVQFKVAPENSGSIIYEYEPDTAVTNYNFTSYATYSVDGANLTVDGIHYQAVPNSNMHFSYWSLKIGDEERKIYDLKTIKNTKTWVYKDATFTAHFAQDGLVAKAVYYEDDPASELGNRLEFVYDDKDYPDAKYVFEVNPDASITPLAGFSSSPTWYELVYKPNSTFDLLASLLLPEDLKHTINADKLGSNYISFDPEVQSVYNNEWVFKTMVEPKTVIFDDSFKNYNELSSISMWFMADHFGTQTYENFYSRVNGELVTGFQNLNTQSIITANYTFGGIFGTNQQSSPGIIWDIGKHSSDDDNRDARGTADAVHNLYGNNLDTYGNSIHELDLTGFNFNSLKDIKGMFANALGLQKIKFPSDLDTSNIYYMEELFANDESLTSSSASFENWDKFKTTNVLAMDRMFYSCSGLTELDLSKFDTRNVKPMLHYQGKIPQMDNSVGNDNLNLRLFASAPEMFFECVRLNKIIINSAFNKSDDNPYYPWAPGWTMNMEECDLPCTVDMGTGQIIGWTNSVYPGKKFAPEDIPFYMEGAFPEEPYTGTFTREPVAEKKVNFVVPAEMQSYGTLDGKTVEQYNFIETAQIQIPTSDATSVLADNTRYKVIPSETGRFTYWTFGDGFSDELKGQVVPDGYINTFFAADPDYPSDGVTFVANFVSNEKTPKAVFTKNAEKEGQGLLTFFYDDIDHSEDEGVLAVYPVVPNTSDYNLPAWYRNSMESWTYGDSHPIPKFQTVIEENAPNGVQAQFDESFIDYKELRSMSCWFMSTMSNDEKSIYPGFVINYEIKMDFGNVPTDCLNNVAYMFGGHEVFNDYMGSKVKNISLSGFNTKGLMKNLDYMFANCIDLEFIDWGGSKTNNVTSMKGMFYNCRAMHGENLEKTLQQLSVENVEDMSYMFARYVNYAEKHATEPPTGIDTNLKFNFPDTFATPKVKNMEGMFSGIATMQTITITGNKFVTPNVENTNYMFANDYFVEHFYLPLTFNEYTNNLMLAKGMFENCRSIKTTFCVFIDDEGDEQDGGIVVKSPSSAKPQCLNLDYCVNMANMFSGCTNLKEFNIPRIVQTVAETGEDVTITDASSMFYACDNLEKVDFACYRFGEASDYDYEGIQCNVNNMFTTTQGLNDVVSEIRFDSYWNRDLVLYDLGFAKNYNNANYVTPVVWINTNNAVSLSAYSVPDIYLKASNYEDSGTVVYQRATKEIVIKNDSVLSEIKYSSSSGTGSYLERDTSIDGYSLGITDDYNAEFRIDTSGSTPVLFVKITYNYDETIYAEYGFLDIMRQQTIKFQNPPVPTWKRYYDWSESKQILNPNDYVEYTDCFQTPVGGTEPTICGFMGCYVIPEESNDFVEAAPVVEAPAASEAENADVEEQAPADMLENLIDVPADDVTFFEDVAVTALRVFALPFPFEFFTMFFALILV